ncbi:Fe-S cluster assembly protein SufD [Shimia sp.]|uniref:Fe-S cluster assembly protein SufD n=1 Tax=Shimia sp. TaxID=1954381 RepID=UPI0035654FBD
MALDDRKRTATEERLAAMVLPEVGCTKEAREKALARLQAMGLPQRRDEYWKYTRPDTLTQPAAPAAAVFKSGEAPVFGAMDCLRIVFVDGLYSPELSDPLELEGVEIDRLEDICCTKEHWAEDLYGELEAAGQTPVERPLAALNTAYAGDGVAIRVTGKPSRPINLVYTHEAEDSDVFLHHVLRIEPGAEATILENGPAAARFNKCIEIDIAEGGTLHHVRAQGRDHERRAVTHLFARLGADAVFKSFTLTVNGVLTRNEAVVELNGDNGVVHIAGACVGNGDFHHDDTVFITHNGANCESRQVFKKVLCNGATGVFQGKILVNQTAQKTDGYQISQSLLLDEDSQFYAKPELEIYADDVACSHGSTSGAIDEEALFYLRARGVPQGPATDLLTLAFLAEAVEEIEDETLAEEIRGRLEGWLVRRRNG